MKSFRKFWKQKGWSISVFLIMAIAVALRFYLFPQRWGIAFDQAHDAIVAREALRLGKIPLLGPFASGANMVGGPQWYWAIAFFTWLYPHSVVAPWVGLAVLSVVFVALMMRIGYLLGDKKLALIIGLIAAFSPLQISQGVNLTNQSPMALVTGISLWALVEYLKSKRPLFAFLLGTGVAAGMNIHLQGAGLLSLILVAIWLGRKHSLKSVFWLLAGFGLQFVPMIIFELRTGFYNSAGAKSYLLYEQKIRGVSTRWLTYVFSFWPDLWRKIAGGNRWTSFLQGIGVSLLVVRGIFRKNLSKRFSAVVFSFILIFISLRYYRGPRFESYFVFVHPFVLFFSAWFVWRVFNWKKLLGRLFLIFLIVTSFQLNLSHYRVEKNTTYPLVKSWEKLLVEKYPHRKFALYDYDLRTRGATASLALVLSADGLIDDQGVKIGVSNVSDSLSERTFYRENFYLSDLSSLDEIGEIWHFLNPSSIWQETEEWYLK